MRNSAVLQSACIFSSEINPQVIHVYFIISLQNRQRDKALNSEPHALQIVSGTNTVNFYSYLVVLDCIYCIF